jgi:hypothetical protein
MRYQMKKRIVGVLAILALVAFPAHPLTITKVTQTEINWIKTLVVNADVVACGAVTTCNITVATLPAAGRVTNAVVRVTGAAVGPTTVTGSLGRVSTGFIDYVVASNVKATGILGDVSGERGTGQADAFFGDVPNLAGTTAINLQLVSTGANLSTVTGFIATVYIRYEIIP